jgi:hypothetical protein
MLVKVPRNRTSPPVELPNVEPRRLGRVLPKKG